MKWNGIGLKWELLLVGEVFNFIPLWRFVLMNTDGWSGGWMEGLNDYLLLFFFSKLGMGLGWRAFCSIMDGWNLLFSFFSHHLLLVVLSYRTTIRQQRQFDKKCRRTKEVESMILFL